MKQIKLGDELHKQITKKCKKRKAYSSFRDNIWGVDLADMQSLRNNNNKNRVFIVCNWYF